MNLRDQGEFVKKCRYRECDKDTDKAFCSDQHMKLERSVKAQESRDREKAERLA